MMPSKPAKYPPFAITAEILTLSQKISRELGRVSGAKKANVNVVLRRINSIKTIQASLAIEGNTLDVDQIRFFLKRHPWALVAIA